MSNDVVVQDIKARLPMPQGMTNIEPGAWRVLCESIFPSARSPEAVVMALDYCRARKLDIFKKPVHIVPMWSSSLGREVETVWPSIGEIQTTAARTKEYAGMDEPKWGEVIEREFEGVRKSGNMPSKIKISFPEWCSVTVYRMIQGQRCAFTEPVYWAEAYGRIGKTELPNDQWAKRPRGMIIKVAKAFSLRAAFPEEGMHTAEEMEGRILEEVDGTGVVIDNTKPLRKKTFKNQPMLGKFIDNVVNSFDRAKTVEELDMILDLNKEKIDEMKENKDEGEEMALVSLRQQYIIAKNRLSSVKEEIPSIDEVLDPNGEFTMPDFLGKERD